MPDIVTHYRFADAVYQKMPEEIRACMERGIFDHASDGPDIWFSYRFWDRKGQKDIPQRGSRMQKERTGEFLLTLAEQARTSEEQQALFSYLAGFLCHYVLDKTTHPYIVAKTGKYDGTEETLPFRGEHMRMERAIDLEFMSRWGVKLREMPITRYVLSLRALPSALRPALNAVYSKVYGWEDAWKDINRGIRDQRLFYLLSQDPTGLLDKLLCLLDNGRGKRDLKAISFYGKLYPEADIFNTGKQEWRHPFDGSLRSQESFDELFEKAETEARGMICAAWKYIFRSETVPLGTIFGSASYETGFGWRDPRNKAFPVCEPMRLGTADYERKG